jgi:predicted GTPase
MKGKTMAGTLRGSGATDRKRGIIIGAAGRDFHDFNVLFRQDPGFEIVAFTASQIPGISGRVYPKELSGKLYPNGIRIYDESELPALIKRLKADFCVQAYSDLSYNTVMGKSSIANANGADFWLVAPERTMIKSSKPVIAVCAVRTGSGKSQTTRYISNILREAGLRVAVIRHPMPYGILKDQMVQRFATMKDLADQKCTIEEREEYEPHIKNGFVVFAGVDYEMILRAAEKEADVILWDGGNNDAPFIKPDLLITVADPLRAGDEITYYPGETVARMADVLLVNKANSATKDELEKLQSNLESINKGAAILLADSVVLPDNKRIISGKRVLVIEDGPTITHGGMRFGAGTVVAKEFGASEIVNAKPNAIGTIKQMYDKYPNLGAELPAVGYSPKQISDLQNTVNRVDCDVVISATPIDLRKLIVVNKPMVQVAYELKPRDGRFDKIIINFARKIKKR